MLMACIGIYFCTAFQDGVYYDGSLKYICIGIASTSIASFAAVGLSLTTYALDHQFFTGGAYFVKVRTVKQTE